MGYMVMKRWFDLTVIEPVPLELAGRGSRLKQPAFTECRKCVQDLYNIIKPQIQDCVYAIFGHSLGSLLAFELVRYLEQKKMKPPAFVVFSGRTAPECQNAVPLIATLSDKEFIRQFNHFQALPQEVLTNEKILELVLPTLRSDVKLAEQYQYEAKSPISSDIYVFYGEEDILLTPEGMKQWEKETTGKTQITVFPGGHFYFKQHVDAFAKKINEIAGYYALEEDRGLW